MVSATKFAILDRVAGVTKPINVSFDMQQHIDDIIEANVDKAFEQWPRSFNEAEEDRRYWQRLDFYKTCVLDALREEHRATAAACFHQYIAAMKRGEELVAA